jgi:putative transposase
VVAEMVCEQLARTATEQHVAVHAYCVMKDHVHLLVRGLEERTDLRGFMKDLKQRTGWWFRRDRDARLWQVSYYDHVLRPEEGTAGVLAHIVNNPVRDGLVAAPLEYPLWGSFTHSREQIVDLIAGADDWKPGDP